MLAKILIERHFNPGNEKEILTLLNKLRSLAVFGVDGNPD